MYIIISSSSFCCCKFLLIEKANCVPPNWQLIGVTSKTIEYCTIMDDGSQLNKVKLLLFVSLHNEILAFHNKKKMGLHSEFISCFNLVRICNMPFWTKDIVSRISCMS